MAYTPNTWATGDTITAQKLNNMEQGIASAGGAFIVGYSFDLETSVTTCNKTAQEIAQAVMGGATVLIAKAFPEEDVCTMCQVVYFDYDNYDPQDFYASMVTINGSGSTVSWTIDSASSYPYVNGPV